MSDDNPIWYLSDGKKDAILNFTTDREFTDLISSLDFLVHSERDRGNPTDSLLAAMLFVLSAQIKFSAAGR